MIVLIDNYDSFTHNLGHLLRVEGEELKVFRSDEIAVDEVMNLKPRRLVISPGPGLPADRGIGVELIRQAAGTIPLLGVCLGHQAIAVAFGASLDPAPEIIHGQTSLVAHSKQGLFESLPTPQTFMRYHSWIVRRSSLPPELVPTAWLADDSEVLMGLQHRELDIHGIQFHPESFLSEDGPKLVRRFLAPSPKESLRK